MPDQPTPSLGRIVHVIVDEAANNGLDVAPAIIARDHGASRDSTGQLRHVVVLRVLGDNNRVDRFGEVSLYPRRPSPEQLARLDPQNPTGRRTVAFWPPRT